MLIKVPESPSNGLEYKAPAKALLESLGLRDASCYAQAIWPLPNMQKSSESEFWHYRSGYSFDSEAWVGNIHTEKGHATLVIFGITHGQRANGGFAVLFYYAYPSEKAFTEYYTFAGCEHEFAHESLGNCQHRYSCVKCKHQYDVDSSG